MKSLMMDRYPSRYGNLVLESNDFLMVKKYLQQPLGLEDYIHENVLELFEENLQDANILDEKNMPSEIVRLYSTVTVFSSSGIEECFQLVPPDEVNLEKAKISVVSSIGCSVLGLSTGDIIKYGVPFHVETLRLTKVSQGNVKTKLKFSEEELRIVLKRDSSTEIVDRQGVEPSQGHGNTNGVVNYQF